MTSLYTLHLDLPERDRQSFEGLDSFGLDRVMNWAKNLRFSEISIEPYEQPEPLVFEGVGEVTREDRGQALIIEVPGPEGTFVRIQSWEECHSAAKAVTRLLHRSLHPLLDDKEPHRSKRLRVTVEVLPEQPEIDFDLGGCDPPLFGYCPRCRIGRIELRPTDNIGPQGEEFSEQYCTDPECGWSEGKSPIPGPKRRSS